jgi:hypothetical protein
LFKTQASAISHPTVVNRLCGQPVNSEWSYEFRVAPFASDDVEPSPEDKPFRIAVHHYRFNGPVSTDLEISFDTFEEAITWLRANVNA